MVNSFSSDLALDSNIIFPKDGTLLKPVAGMIFRPLNLKPSEEVVFVEDLYSQYTSSGKEPGDVFQYGLILVLFEAGNRPCAFEDIHGPDLSLDLR